MIRSLWIIITTVALANLLAIGGFAAWLKMDDRLDRERIERVRQIFAQTRAEERAEAAEAERERRREEDEAKEAARNALPPITADDKLLLQSEESELGHMRVERLRREMEDLQRTLVRERAALDAEKLELDRERAEFEAMRERIAAIEGGEQFKRALSLYSAMPAAKAQAVMQTLIDKGEVEQVVAYLNAMQTRTATKIIEKFEDPMVAADLLERLRTRGIEARVPEAE